MTKIYPQHDKVLVDPEKADDKTASGIIVPEDNEPRTAKVLSVGPGGFNYHGMRNEMSAQEGETVLYCKHALERIKIGDEEFCFIDDDDIIAVIE